MSSKQLLAAAVEVDITPPAGVNMDGYAARKQRSLGVHDPLLAQLLFLKSGDSELALISMDCIGVELEFSQQVRRAIRDAVGMPEQCILIGCSHTHSGPAGFLPNLIGLENPADLDLQRIVKRKLTGAAIQAREQLQPAKLGIAHGVVKGIGTNRNDPENGLSDNEVIVIRIDDGAGNPIAVWMNFGCHPTVLGAKNLLISAEYPGAARAALRRIYPETIFMYANGASGDISTRFSRRSQTFAEVTRMGRILAGEVLKAMQSVAYQDKATLTGRINPIELPFRDFPSDEDVQKQIREYQVKLESLKAVGASRGEIRRAKTDLQGAVGQEMLVRELKGKDRAGTEMQVLTIGDLALVGLPGEPFTHIVLEIKKKSPYLHTAIVSYSNDEAGYFPDVHSFDVGTYEALITPYRSDIADLLVQNALTMLKGK